ncbi:transcriptional activator hac1 [Anaeramoeba flamelloides]|uniref:Transcriptional activator hac1 n=1 Tax=Anaeramoeba flamelloides TaxID=1746091 RepID=A0ABQ8XWY3_9EUKA|nr:transcriptional activator hac1 [Anaeramoeba flamelloides]
MSNFKTIIKRAPRNKKPLGRVEIIKDKPPKTKNRRKRDHCETNKKKTNELEEHLYEKNTKGEMVDILATMSTQEYSLLTSEQKKRRRVLRNRLNAQNNRNKKKRGLQELERKFDQLSNEHHQLNDHVAQLTAEKDQMQAELLLLKKLLYDQEKENKSVNNQTLFSELEISQSENQTTFASSQDLEFEEFIFDEKSTTTTYETNETNETKKLKNKQTTNIQIKQEEKLQEKKPVDQVLVEIEEEVEPQGKKESQQQTGQVPSKGGDGNVFEGWYGESFDENFLLEDDDNSLADISSPNSSGGIMDELSNDPRSPLLVEKIFTLPNTVNEDGNVGFTGLINDNKFGFSLFFIFTFVGLMFCWSSIPVWLGGNPSLPIQDNNQPTITDPQLTKNNNNRKTNIPEIKQRFFRRRSIKTLQTEDDGNAENEESINQEQERCPVKFNNDIIFNDSPLDENSCEYEHGNGKVMDEEDKDEPEADAEREKKENNGKPSETQMGNEKQHKEEAEEEMEEITQIENNGEDGNEINNNDHEDKQKTKKEIFQQDTQKTEIVE